MKRKALQYALYCLLCGWGTVSIIYYAAEENPAQPIGETWFYGIKLACIVSMWLCCRTWKWLDKKGLLPEL